jgi:hypothetical protein
MRALEIDLGDGWTGVHERLLASESLVVALPTRLAKQPIPA